jgi:simple sugar transport system permease protein
VGAILALVLAGTLWVFDRKTLAGFQLRATGANPLAAKVIGRVKTDQVFAAALIISGACAGLAGATEISGTTYALFQNLSPGYGFTAIAVALLARLDPLATILTGLLFAGLEAGASAMQREAGVPAVSVFIVEAVIIIVVLLTEVGRRKALARGKGAES